MTSTTTARQKAKNIEDAALYFVLKSLKRLVEERFEKRLSSEIEKIILEFDLMDMLAEDGKEFELGNNSLEAVQYFIGKIEEQLKDRNWKI